MPRTAGVLRHAMNRLWYGRQPLARVLLPLSFLYCSVVRLRRLAYRRGLLGSVRLPVPVIVVGNLTVGGTGKTPLIVWLSAFLRRHGYRPGIVSRGYGGRAAQWPRAVHPDSDPAEVGDEPVLLARRCGCPVYAGPQRVGAARMLLEHHGCDVLLADDGLQHYALARDLEIAVIDGERRFGNGHCLPAGPLREPLARLRSVALLVSNGPARGRELAMHLVATGVHSVQDDGAGPPLRTFLGRRLHALAGIGNPTRFFDTLRRHGLDIVEHPLADHHAFRASDLQFGDGAVVFMTEKDAVKCRRFARPGHWYLAVDAEPDAALGERILTLLRGREHGQDVAGHPGVSAVQGPTRLPQGSPGADL